MSDRKNNEEKSTLRLISISNFKNKTFEIGRYQRGFKWGKKEILELLNDINAYKNEYGLYCLQPIILKPLSNETQKIVIDDGLSCELSKQNEVIDGQQRTTTIFLILKYLVHRKLIKSDLLFHIDFKTRKRSGDFLSNKLDEIFNLDLNGIIQDELDKKDYQDTDSLNLLWNQYIQNNPNFDNIDVYHFFTVCCYLKRWIETYLNNKLELKKFIRKLLREVKIIWYSLDDCINDNKVIEVFLNNNKGKIGLTSSELIKALFILDIKNTEVSNVGEIKTNQFADEWNMVEQKLQDDSFWYFIQPDENKYREGTRIDFLFDLHFRKPVKSDSFYSYRKLENSYNKKEDFGDVWENILQLFYKLLNWHNDSETYHLVGFLTSIKIKSIYNLIKEHEGKSQDDFKTDLTSYIKTRFKKTKETETGEKFNVYNLQTLNYEDNYNECMEILLLFNCLYYSENMAGYKFPFELFLKEKWSIEHILPQNPKEFDEINIYKQWIYDLLEYTNIELKVDLKLELENAKSFEEIDKNNSLKFEIEEVINESKDITHLISNLLLLDRNTNSSLSNKLFADKRKAVLKFYKNSKNDKDNPVFIPPETINAFNKVNSEKINIENWTKDDADNYVEAIKKRLKEFLPKK